MRPTIFCTRGQWPGQGLSRLSAHADVVLWDGNDKPSAPELQSAARGATAILALGSDIVDGPLLDACGPQLMVVALASMGFDAIDQPAAQERGVVVTHTPGVLAETTADLAFALALMARRRLGAARDSLYAGEWRLFRMTDYLGLDVHHATLGLIGYGQVGRAVARRAKGFSMRVLHYDPSAAPADEWSQAASLDVLLRESDIVSVHVPLTADTERLIGPVELRKMKRTATLVNTARGGVIDEGALLQALREGVIHSAGVDVFKREPLGPDVGDLVKESRLVALPHVGSATESTRAAMVDLAVENVLDILADRPARTPLPHSLARPRATVE